MVDSVLERHNVSIAGNVNATKTMVFVNGLGYDQSFWNRVAPAFANSYRQVLFDNIGAVPSNQAYFRQRETHYLDVSGYATDLLDLCAALKLDRNVVLVGHSLGALAGILASIQKPSVFSHLILLGASPRYANTDGYVGGFTPGEINATYKALMGNYQEWTRQLAVTAIGTQPTPDLAQSFGESLARVPKEMMLTVLCSVLQTDHRADLAKVSVPSLIIQSMEDFFVPRSVAEFLHAQVPQSTLTMINAQGHLPHLSAPQEVINAIKGFLG